MKIPDIAACIGTDCKRTDTCIRFKHQQHVRPKWQVWMIFGIDIVKVDDCRFYAQDYLEITGK